MRGRPTTGGGSPASSRRKPACSDFAAHEGYAAAHCDEDGSGIVDDVDRIGGHHPALPMALVPVPGAQEVWLHLGALD